MDHRRGPCREITPAAGPCVADGLAVIASADFIYWMARQDHIAYAYTTGTTALAAGGTPAQGRVVMPESGFKPGFKIGLGLDLDHDGWDVFAEYTWFHSNHSHSHGNRDDEDSVSATSTLDLHAPYWDVNGFNQFGTLFTSASAQWKLQMNILDLELGRNFYISESLMLRPQVGMKMTWDTQRYNTSYTNDTIVLSMNQKDTIQGYGIRAGIDTAWHFTRSFSFVGDLAFTGLWESFHVKRNDSNLVTATGISTNDLNVKSRHNNVRPIIEWRAGLRWESWWCADRYHVAIDAGWEQQVWVNQNQFFVISPTEHKNGDLSLQGLDIKVRFDF
jgi:hypothetical protein